MLYSICRQRLVGTLGALLLLVIPPQGWAVDLEKRQAFDIKPQSVISALLEFSQQAQIQIMSSKEEIEAQQSPGINGEYTLSSALEHLLAGTGLRYRATGDSTILIMAEPLKTSQSGALARVAQLSAADSDSSASESSASPNQETRSEAQQGHEGLEEIIVTAQKRRERLQDVPISISVLGGQQLDSRAIGSAADALRAVPGVSFRQSTFGTSQALNIRGVAPQYGSGTVGYYMDGVPFGFVSNSFVPDTNVYDLERIEVLRGPQGTLYGASSLNGVVRVLTHDVDLDSLSAKARAGILATEGGGETYRIDGAFNAPIIDGRLGVRGALSYADGGGWIDSFAGKNVNQTENIDARIKVKAQPTDALSIGMSYWRSRHDMGAIVFSDPNDFYPGNLKPEGELNFDVLGGELVYEFPGATLSSTTSYMKYTNISQTDWSAFLIKLPNFGIQGYFNTRFVAKVFSQETVLRSSGTGNWAWIAGVFYREAKDRFDQRCVDCFTSPTPVGQVIFSDDRTQSKSYAAFGEVTRRLMDNTFELSAGLRYFHDQVENSAPTNFPSYNPAATFERLSPRVVMTWHPEQNSTVYASYSQGFRSGINQSATTLAAFASNNAPPFPPVEPDKLDNYEVGAKGSFWDGRLSYEAAVYYIKWHDAQQNLTINYGLNNEFGTAAGLNAGSVSGVGGEFSVASRPVERLTINASVATNGITVDQPLFDGPNTLYTKGSRLNDSSEYTASVGVEYKFPLNETLGAAFSLSGDYASGMPARALFSGNVFEVVLQDAFFSVQASAKIANSDRWSLEMFADNLTNNRATTQGFTQPVWDFYTVRSRPRTIGFQLELKY